MPNLPVTDWSLYLANDKAKDVEIVYGRSILKFRGALGRV